MKQTEGATGSFGRACMYMISERKGFIVVVKEKEIGMMPGRSLEYLVVVQK